MEAGAARCRSPEKRDGLVNAVVERFLRYVRYDTKSDENAKACPSTPGQMVFAEALADELRAIGLAQAGVNADGYVTAVLPSNIERDAPVIGFIAHMDTSPDMPGAGVNPQVIGSYDGGDIVLDAKQGIVLSPRDFPELMEYKGNTIITTDGTTLLGADDKAGIAEIVSAFEYLLRHPEVKHGTVKLCFTPDEEIGRGADKFPLAGFADFAYTVDGGGIGNLEFENFNAAKAAITLQGKNVHPGTAKDKMVNSMLLAVELAGMLPAKETPSWTDGYEGFYHLTNFCGKVERTVLKYIIRDFDRERFMERKNFLVELVDDFNKRYGDRTAEILMEDQYFNMREIIEKNMQIVDLARRAMEMAGIEPRIVPVRGGTDGARLSYMGLPTPNLFSGGHNYHGRYEYIPTSSMEAAVKVIINIMQLNAEVIG